MESNNTPFQFRLFKLFMARYLRRLTKRIWLIDQPELGLSNNDLNRILESSWKEYFRLISELDKQANLGNWLVMNFAYLTLAAYQVFLKRGMKEQEAIKLIYQLTWHITSTWALRAKRVSKSIIRAPMRELAFFVDLVMKTFFSPPAYQFDTGKTGRGFYLDVKRCPVAEMMAANNASELCIQTWCGVDFGLVEIIGGSLQREGTLAMGREKCDFVFLPQPQDY